MDLSVNPFNSGRASYFHNAFGGYHAAKPRSVQDIMSYQIEKNNLEVLNMMNVKYLFNLIKMVNLLPIKILMQMEMHGLLKI